MIHHRTVLSAQAADCVKTLKLLRRWKKIPYSWQN